MSGSRYIVVDPETLKDVVKAANRVAPRPTSGSTFDQAGGIRFELQSTSASTAPELLVKATNLESTFRAEVPLADYSDPLPPTFRLPSAVLTGYLNKLDASKPVRIDIETSEFGTAKGALIKSGRQKVKLTCIQGDGYPVIETFRMDSLGQVDDLSSLLDKISWARATNRIPFDGIRVDGTYLQATNLNQLARVTCPLPVPEPITAPMPVIKTALTGHGKASVAMAVERGKLLVMPDDRTQFASTLYQGQFPDLSVPFERQTPKHLTPLAVDSLLAPLERLHAFSANSVRSGDAMVPTVQIDVVEGLLHLSLEVPEVGIVEESVEVEFEWGREPFFILLDINILLAAIRACGTDDDSKFLLGVPESNLSPLYLSDDQGYEALLMPIKPKSDRRMRI